MGWCSPTSPQPKTIRLQKSKTKTLLIAFFYNKGIIHKEFVPAGQTINSAFYQAVLNWLLQRRVRPELNRTGKWMLLHDNVLAHSAIRVRQFLAQKMVAVLDLPSCSPDLAPVDFFLLPAWRRSSKVHVLRAWMPSKIVWQPFCDRFHRRPLLIVSGSLFNYLMFSISLELMEYFIYCLINIKKILCANVVKRVL